MTVLVTTPRGKVGAELVKLLRARGVPLRLGAHAVEATRAAFPHVEIAPLDYEDPGSVAAALRGVRAVYLAAPADSPAERELRLIDLATEANVESIVKLSALGAEKADTPQRRVERHLEKSSLAWTVLRPCWFDQNYATSQVAAIRAGVLAEPAGDAKTAFIDTRDIAAVAAEALTSPKHAGKTYALTGPELLTRVQIAEVLAHEIGKPVGYRSISDEQFRMAVGGRMPGAYVELLSALYARARAREDEARTDDVAEVLGRAPTSFATFARDYRSAWT